MCFTHTMEYYAAFKKKENLQFVTTWMTPEDIMLSKINQSSSKVLTTLLDNAYQTWTNIRCDSLDFSQRIWKNLVVLWNIPVIYVKESLPLTYTSSDVLNSKYLKHRPNTEYLNPISNVKLHH